MRNFTDEELMAYADGELPAAEAQTVAAAALRDSGLARRIACFADSRRLLKEVFAGRLQDAVPQRLLDSIEERPRARSGNRFHARRWVPMALAASVALAIGLFGGRWLPMPSPEPQTVLVAGLPRAAALQRALESAASGVVQEGEDGGIRYEIVPVASLQNPDGRYCRQFESTVFAPSGPEKAQGYACRDASGYWQAHQLATVPQGSTPADTYELAGGQQAARPAGRPLTPQEELQALREGWRGQNP